MQIEYGMVNLSVLIVQKQHAPDNHDVSKLFSLTEVSEKQMDACPSPIETYDDKLKGVGKADAGLSRQQQLFMKWLLLWLPHP